MKIGGQVKREKWLDTDRKLAIASNQFTVIVTQGGPTSENKNFWIVKVKMFQAFQMKTDRQVKE